MTEKRWQEPGKGAKRNETSRRLSVTLDDETVDTLRAFAVKRRVSLSAIVREVVEIGLETSMEDWR